jgi:hypothetical protein
MQDLSNNKSIINKKNSPRPLGEGLGVRDKSFNPDFALKMPPFLCGVFSFSFFAMVINGVLGLFSPLNRNFMLRVNLNL